VSSSIPNPRSSQIISRMTCLPPRPNVLTKRLHLLLFFTSVPATTGFFWKKRGQTRVTTSGIKRHSSKFWQAHRLIRPPALHFSVADLGLSLSLCLFMMSPVGSLWARTRRGRRWEQRLWNNDEAGRSLAAKCTIKKPLKCARECAHCVQQLHRCVMKPSVTYSLVVSDDFTKHFGHNHGGTPLSSSTSSTAVLFAVLFAGSGGPRTGALLAVTVSGRSIENTQKH